MRTTNGWREQVWFFKVNVYSYIVNMALVVQKKPLVGLSSVDTSFKAVIGLDYYHANEG